MKKRFGDLLILFSFLLLTYIYYPILTAYIPASSSQMYTQNGQSAILIPKINAHAPVVEDVDPGNLAEYKTALQHGVAEAKGFSKPGEGKLVYIFAHSSLPPWEMTRTNTAFLRLGELQNGDQILINKADKQFKYEVFQKLELWPSQTEIFNQERNKDELVLQTCTPVGTDFKRLLVFAKPI